MRSYYVLLSNASGRWGVEFGDYVRRVVMDELRDTRGDYPKGTKFKVINVAGDTQAAIDAAVAKENK